MTNHSDASSAKRNCGATAQLLTYGENLIFPIADWADYPSLGITSTDVPGLIELVTDTALYAADLDDAAGWAPVHAWRALAQLKAGEAVEPLLQTYERLANHEDWWQWFSDELPEVFLIIGEAAIAGLRRYLSQRTQSQAAGFSQFVAIEGLERITKAYPDCTPQCIEICTEELRYAAKHNPDVNGFLIGVLASFKVVEAASVIEQAFAGGYVDPSISGDWDDIQVDLGLKSRAEMRQRRPFGAVKQPRFSFVEPARGYRSPLRSTEFKGFSGGSSKPESQRKNRKKKK
jgi:hypothetical protein